LRKICTFGAHSPTPAPIWVKFGEDESTVDYVAESDTWTAVKD